MGVGEISAKTIASNRTSPPDLPNYIVVAGVAFLAVGVSAAWWSKTDVSIFFANAEIRRGQLWRLFTAIFPHVDILHVAFNIYAGWGALSSMLGPRGKSTVSHLTV